MTGLLLGLLVLGAQARAEEVVLWHAYQDVEEAGLVEAVAAWSRSSGVKVELNAVPYGAYNSKLETAVPRGNGPDVFIAAHDNLGKWSSMGVVQAADDLDVSGQRPITAQAVVWQGKTYGLPIAYKSLLLLYDPSLVSTPPTTTDELIEQAKALTGDGRFGLAYQGSEAYYHVPWLHAFGGSVLENGTAHLDSDAQVQAYALAQRLMVGEGIAPAQPTAELMTRLYAQGDAAFVISGPWFAANVSRPIAAAPLPIVSESGQPARPFLTVDVAFLAGQAAHPQRARELIRFLAGPEGAQIRQDVGGQAVSATAVSSSDPLLRVMAEQAEQAVLMPADPVVSSAYEAMNRVLRRLQRGAVSPERAAHDAQQYFEVLSRPPPPPASPWPYLAVLLVALGVAGAWFGAPLLDAGERRRIRSHWRDYLWVAPAGIAMSVLVVLPFLLGATVSLFAHDAGSWTFVGLQHFLDIILARDWPISSPLSFVFTLGVTILWTFTNVVLHITLGIALALVLREPWIHMRGVWRAALIIPWAVPNYITALIWKGMFHAQYGAINALLGLVLLRDGPVEIDWFGSFVTSFGANLATNTWLGFPFMMVVTLGALQSIPRDLEEAAEVDGASWWFRFRHVVWPLLQPALLPAIILGSVWTFNMFNVIYLVSAGEPDSSTEILISEAYRWAFSRGNRYGYASAYAVMIFGVLLVYSKAANRLVGRKVL